MLYNRSSVHEQKKTLGEYFTQICIMQQSYSMSLTYYNQSSFCWHTFNFKTKLMAGKFPNQSLDVISSY